jgi:hypothetical protein
MASSVASIAASKRGDTASLVTTSVFRVVEWIANMNAELGVGFNSCASDSA